MIYAFPWVKIKERNSFKMKINIQAVSIFVSLWYTVEIVDVTSAQPSIYLTVDKGRHDVNESIIAATFGAISLAQCSYRCARDSSTSLYFVEDKLTCHCNNGLDNDTYEDTGTQQIIYGSFYSIKEPVRYKDCLDVYQANFTASGVYTIQPDGQPAVDTWCEMSGGGGWTVFQRRLDGSVNFYRGWSDYVAGFGDKEGEYWLGLDNLHALTTQPSQLKIDMMAFPDLQPSAAFTTYAYFKVDGPSTLYRLHWNGSWTSCGELYELFDAENGMSFSTFDRDNDNNEDRSCAVTFTGAWWYNMCFNYNLNGRYNIGVNISEWGGIKFTPCWGSVDHYSLKTVMMRVRRNWIQ